MSITTYSELQTAVADWHHRDVTQIPDFIKLAEKRINTLLASRVAETDASLTGSIGSRYITLPTRFISPTGLWFTTYLPRVEVPYLTPEQLPVSSSNGTPLYYSIDGANLAFNCPCSAAYTYTLRYKKGYDIASTSTNDILTNYPNLYLFGALVEACTFARDYKDAEMFEARFKLALDEAQNAEFSNRSNATLQSDLNAKATGNIIDGGA